MRIEEKVEGLLLLQGAMEHRLEDIDLNKGNKFVDLWWKGRNR